MLIPSIDLQSGRIVQLVQGEQLALATDDFDGWIEKFSRAPMVQLIDLDAARGEGSNRALIKDVCARLPCQAGGGIRSVADARDLIDAGARRVIVGSALFAEDGVDVRAARQFSEAIGANRLVAAVDGRGGNIAVRGWKATLKLPVVEALAPLEALVVGFLATLIDGEGRMGGLDLRAATEIRRATVRQVMVAGGVRSLAEVVELERLGMDAVVGMAIYTGAIDVNEAFVR
jgi:phosphoribosylformimino-5-aminoimidazole carboxamide ribotide isomerase